MTLFWTCFEKFATPLHIDVSSGGSMTEQLSGRAGEYHVRNVRQGTSGAGAIAAFEARIGQTADALRNKIAHRWP